MRGSAAVPAESRSIGTLSTAQHTLAIPHTYTPSLTQLTPSPLHSTHSFTQSQTRTHLEFGGGLKRRGGEREPLDQLVVVLRPVRVPHADATVLAARQPQLCKRKRDVTFAGACTHGVNKSAMLRSNNKRTDCHNLPPSTHTSTRTINTHTRAHTSTHEHTHLVLCCAAGVTQRHQMPICVRLCDR